MTKQNLLKKFAINISKKITKKNAQYFKRPFKHIIIDDVLKETFARNCLKSFPP